MSGSLMFTSISAGSRTSCGLAATGRTAGARRCTVPRIASGAIASSAEEDRHTAVAGDVRFRTTRGPRDIALGPPRVFTDRSPTSLAPPDPPAASSPAGAPRSPPHPPRRQPSAERARADAAPAIGSASVELLLVRRDSIFARPTASSASPSSSDADRCSAVRGARCGRPASPSPRATRSSSPCRHEPSRPAPRPRHARSPSVRGVVPLPASPAPCPRVPRPRTPGRSSPCSRRTAHGTGHGLPTTGVGVPPANTDKSSDSIA